MTESHWMIVAGLVLLPTSFWAFMRPERFMRGRRSSFWVRLLGEEGTKKLIRYFSVPLMVLISLALIVMGFLELFPGIL